MLNHKKVSVLGCKIDSLSLEEAGNVVIDWLKPEETSATTPCRVVVTPNLDHAVQLRQNIELQTAYANASLVLADGMPIIWSSRLCGTPLPERVAGSDLAPWVLSRAPQGTRVYFLGASEESSRAAVENVERDFPQLAVVGRCSPPFGFEKDPAQNEAILAEIRQCRAQLIVLGLGAPKQELWVDRHRDALPGTVVLCVGATIDFLAGSVQRAPRWMQVTGTEWLHRLLSNPKRLALRYGKDALYFPWLLASDLARGRMSRTQTETSKN